MTDGPDDEIEWPQDDVIAPPPPPPRPPPPQFPQPAIQPAKPTNAGRVIAIVVVVIVLFVGGCAAFVGLVLSGSSGHIDTANDYLNAARSGDRATMVELACNDDVDGHLAFFSRSRSQDLNTVSVVNGNGTSSGALVLEDGTRRQVDVDTRSRGGGQCVSAIRVT